MNMLIQISSFVLVVGYAFASSLGAGEVYYSINGPPGIGGTHSANLDGSEDQIIAGFSGRDGFAVDLTNRRLFGASEPGRFIIQSTNLDGSNVQEILAEPNIGPLRDIDVDPVDQHIYWSALATRSIRRADYSGGNVETVVDTLASSPTDIAMDSIGRKLYWSTFDYDVQRADLDGSNIETLFSCECHQEIALTIDPIGEKLYFSTWPDSNGPAFLNEMNLDGSGLRQLGSSTTFAESAHDIDIDWFSQHVYVGLYRRFNLNTMEFESSGFPRSLSFKLALPIPEPGGFGMAAIAFFLLLSSRRGNPPSPRRRGV